MEIIRSAILCLFLVAAVSAQGLAIDGSLSGGATIVNSERSYESYDNQSVLRFGATESPYIWNAHSTTMVSLGRSGINRKSDGVEAYGADLVAGTTGVMQVFDSVGMESEQPNVPESMCDQQGLAMSNVSNATPGALPESQDFEGMVGMVGATEGTGYQSAIATTGKQVDIGVKRETEAGYVYTDLKGQAIWGWNENQSVPNAVHEAREHLVSATNKSANISDIWNYEWDVKPAQD